MSIIIDHICFPNGLRLQVINISDVIARKIIEKEDLKLDSMIGNWKEISEIKTKK